MKLLNKPRGVKHLKRQARNWVEVTLMGAYTSFLDWKTDHGIVFICKDFKITGQPDGEIAEVRAFSLNELPEDLWPSHRLRLEEYAEGIPQPQFGEW